MNDFSDLIKTVDKVRSIRATKYSNYALTESGREEAEAYGGAGLEWEILNYLADHSRQTSREISDGIHVEERKVKAALERLIAKQRVIKVAR